GVAGEIDRTALRPFLEHRAHLRREGAAIAEGHDHVAELERASLHGQPERAEPAVALDRDRVTIAAEVDAPLRDEGPIARLAVAGVRGSAGIRERVTSSRR